MTNMWNYRLVKTKDKDHYKIGIHEVYYDKDNKPFACSIEPESLCLFLELDASTEEEIVSELKDNLDYILKAFNKPILNIDTDFTSNPM